jgi:hypothetical protein
MKIRKRYVLLAALIALVLWFVIPHGARPGHVLDEPKRAGLTAAAFQPASQIDLAHDFFHDMDRGVTLDTKQEVNGRNMWIVWTGGDDRLWNEIARLSLGNTDLLKTVSSYNPDKDPTLSESRKEELRKRYHFRRSNRWEYMGTVNEPCFQEAQGPDPKRFGLWLDRRDSNCPPEPFEDETRYPGVRIGARGKNIPVGSYYGYSSGVLGLRLFPNPDFDEAAAKKWDPVRYYTDPAYYKSKDLVRPYRVGQACGFCHVGPNPVHPPADPGNPAWENLSSIVGSQYLRLDRVFSWESPADNFITQVFRTWRPGTNDTSFIPQDNINNPRTINAIYEVGARLQLAKSFGKEHLSEANRDNFQLNNFVPKDSALAGFFAAPDTVYTMHVLKNGADSVGVIGALNRVYLSIGLFSEEWLLHFTPNTGGSRITPIEVKNARRNSIYWQATEAQSFDLAAFLVKASGRPHRLSDARPVPAAPASEMETGKRVFADRCAQCHSSKLPELPASANPAICTGNYLECWNRYWKWTHTDAYRTEARRIVAKPDFLDGNYLATDFRVPVTLVKADVCTSLATNAIAGNIWDNFSSDTYKNLPSVGNIDYYDPFTGEKKTYAMPGGGRGYLRPAPLVSLWSTAPYLYNNSVGPFTADPSVTARLKEFQVSMIQMLWPETREKDSLLGAKIPGKIDRTTAPSYLGIPRGYLPGAVGPMLGLFASLMPGLFSGDGEHSGVLVGPFPTGMPVDLIANAQLALDQGSRLDEMRFQARLLPVFRKLISAVNEARGKSDEEARRIVFRPEVVEPLMSLSKCPDYIVNRGHYFGAEGGEEAPLSNSERGALIVFLRTF